MLALYRLADLTVQDDAFANSIMRMKCYICSCAHTSMRPCICRAFPQPLQALHKTNCNSTMCNLKGLSAERAVGMCLVKLKCHVIWQLADHVKRIIGQHTGHAHMQFVVLYCAARVPSANKRLKLQVQNMLDRSTAD